MTLAGAAEGIAKLLMTPEEKTSDCTEEDIESLRSHIKDWSGDVELRNRTLQSIGSAHRKGVGRYLRDLAEKGIVNTSHTEAWDAVRNEVMHGNLVSPWGGEEEDRNVRNLADLVHRLTRELIRRKSE
jgi:hypothetical protein